MYEGVVIEQEMGVVDKTIELMDKASQSLSG